MGVIVANGLRVHHQRMRGRGRERPPTVVFVHGLGYDSLASFYLTLAAPVAEAGMDVLTYDLRGHGRTDRPRAGYEVGDFVSDLAHLLDALGLHEPVHLVGNSFGGTIAFAFAARYPRRVRGIVAIEAEPPTIPWAEKMGRTLANVVDGMTREETLAWVGATFGAHHARLARIAGTIIDSTTIVADVPKGPLLDAAELREITCPVLSIVGSEGFQSEDLLAVERALPDCRTEVIAGQNHSVLVERHRTVRRLLLDWVNDLAARDTVGVA